MAARRCSWWLMLATTRLLRALAESPPCGPVDCADLECWEMKTAAAQQVSAPTPLWLTCDFSTAGGGWTVMQRRRDWHVDFYRKWSEYKHGFGSRDTFWLGLVHIHLLTRKHPATLRVELEVGPSARMRHIEYENFSVGSEDDRFRLQLGRPVAGNTIPDELRNHTGPFCARDSPDSEFCREEARVFHTGWWFSRKLFRLGADLNSRLVWSARNERVYWRGLTEVSATAMMFRPRAFRGGQGRMACDRSCPNGGTCHRNTTGHFRCTCAPGYEGRQCLQRTGLPGPATDNIRYIGHLKIVTVRKDLDKHVKPAMLMRYDS